MAKISTLLKGDSTILMMIAAAAVAVVVYLYFRKPPSPPTPPIPPTPPTPPPTTGYAQFKALGPPPPSNGYKTVTGGIKEISDACSSDPMCAGFTSDGTLQTFIPNSPTLIPSKLDTYIRKFAVPKGYSIIPKMSGGNNLSPLGGYVPDMAQACNNNPQCVGFSMFGLLYDFIPNASGLTPNPGDNIFVKSFTQPKGYTVKIGQTGGSNMMSAPSAYVPMMADLCNKTAGCTGFDTSGLLKEGPITLSPNSNLNIYVKTTP